MAAVVAGVVVAAAGVAEDLSGVWRAQFRGPGGDTAIETLELLVKDGRVAGKLTNAVGGTAALRDGRWDGTVLRFWVPWDPGRLEATGKLVKDAIELDMKTSQWHVTHVFRRVPSGGRLTSAAPASE